MSSWWQVVRLALSAATSALVRKRVLNCLWELTYRCNARCTICPLWRNGGTGGKELSTTEIRAGLALLQRHGLRAVNFTGGEPLLREDLEGPPDWIICWFPSTRPAPGCMMSTAGSQGSTKRS